MEVLIGRKPGVGSIGRRRGYVGGPGDCCGSGRSLLAERREPFADDARSGLDVCHLRSDSFCHLFLARVGYAAATALSADGCSYHDQPFENRGALDFRTGAEIRVAARRGF